MHAGLRPRVLHVVSHLDLGGAEEVAISLAEGLSAEQDLHFFAVGGVASGAVGQAMHARLTALGVPVHSGTPLPMKRGGLVQAGARLNALLRRLCPDLVHLHTEIPETTYALAALAGAPRSPVLRTIHNATVWPAWGRIGGWVEGRLGSASAVAVSRDSLEGLQAFRTRWERSPLPAERARVIYNGVRLAAPTDGAVAASVTAAGVAADGGAEGEVRILFAGRLEPQKGADLLPDVLERACALTGRSARVTVLGDGSLTPALRRWADGTRLRWPVTLAPPQPGLSGMLASYDVVLMPSRFEGLPLLAAEALLAGTPVVATDIPGLREVLAPGYPLLAAAEDVDALAARLAEVLEDPARFRALARKLRGDIETRFGLGRMVGEYREVYRDLLRPGAVPACVGGSLA